MVFFSFQQAWEKVACIVLHVLKHYFMVATYMWMLCEGKQKTESEEILSSISIIQSFVSSSSSVSVFLQDYISSLSWL